MMQALAAVHFTKACDCLTFVLRSPGGIETNYLFFGRGQHTRDFSYKTSYAARNATHYMARNATHYMARNATRYVACYVFKVMKN